MFLYNISYITIKDFEFEILTFNLALIFLSLYMLNLTPVLQSVLKSVLFDLFFNYLLVDIYCHVKC